MAEALYEFSIQDDFPNQKVSQDRLFVDLAGSSIQTALVSVTVIDDDVDVRYMDTLSTEDHQTLNQMVAAHDGEPLVKTPDEVKIYGQEYDASNRVIQRTIGQKTQEPTCSRTTHDYCNRCTWYSDSVRVTDEVMTVDTGLIYKCANDAFIDVINGVINRQDLHQVYAIEVKVSDVVQTSGYTIHHSTGKIEFDSAPGGDVKISYSYPTTSNWRLPVPAGKQLIIEHSEVQFTTDVNVTSPLKFEVWVDNPYYGVSGHPWELIPRIPGETVQYNSIRDIINESNLGFQVPAMLGIGEPLIIFPFNYVGEKVMDSSMNAELVVSCVNDEELPGTYGTATFYLIERTSI